LCGVQQIARIHDAARESWNFKRKTLRGKAKTNNRYDNTDKVHPRFSGLDFEHAAHGFMPALP
jgi:hypothetical protein